METKGCARARGRIVDIRDVKLEKVEDVDIVRCINDYVPLTQVGGTTYLTGSFIGSCPFCYGNHGSFVVSPKKQVFYCFDCKAGGNAHDFTERFDAQLDEEEQERDHV